MLTPDIKLAANTISDDVKEIVKNFYEDEEISRSGPGKQDYQIISENGERIFNQLRLIFCNLQEAYSVLIRHFLT